MHDPSAPQRLCPVCGALSDEEFCARDRTATVLARAFTKHPRSYDVGDVVAGRYRITGALGAGGFAAVYSAEHTGTHQEVAVKLMTFDPSADTARVSVRRFFREAQVMARLKSPNTVRVFDVGQDDGGALFIAMERLHGESLEDLLKRRLRASDPLTERETLDIALPVLDSLIAAHGMGLVHRDLKPANIFLCSKDGSEQIVKVLDFGIARTADSSLTVGGSIPGTPPFMSPEQCRGEEVDGRSDLYSLSALLFLCATARLPFHHANVLKLMRMHAFDPPPDPRTMTDRPLSDGFVAILRQMLAKKPQERLADAATMKLELERVRDGVWVASAWDGATDDSTSVVADGGGAVRGEGDDVEPGAAKVPPRPGSGAFLADGDDDPAPARAPGSSTPAPRPAGSPVDVSEATPTPAPRAAAAEARTDGVEHVRSASPTASGQHGADVGPPVVQAAAGAGVTSPAVASTRTPDVAHRAEPAAAPPAVSAAPAGVSRTWIVVAAIAVLVAVVAVAAMVLRAPEDDHAKVAAELAAKLASEATDPQQRVAFAREAVRLQPDNAAWRSLLRQAERAASTPAASAAATADPQPAAPEPDAAAPSAPPRPAEGAAQVATPDAGAAGAGAAAPPAVAAAADAAATAPAPAAGPSAAPAPDAAAAPSPAEDRVEAAPKAPVRPTVTARPSNEAAAAAPKPAEKVAPARARPEQAGGLAPALMD